MYVARVVEAVHLDVVWAPDFEAVREALNREINAWQFLADLEAIVEETLSRRAEEDPCVVAVAREIYRGLCICSAR